MTELNVYPLPLIPKPRDARAERRERIATAILAAAVALPRGNDFDSAEVIKHCVRWADALIAELDK